MKRHLASLPLLLMAVSLLASVSANAQSANALRADVPFDFIVGDKTIQAGTIITRGETTQPAGPLSISNLDNGQQVSRVARAVLSGGDSKQAKLVFHKYGDQYYLAQVWIPGYRPLEVMKSKSERARQREMGLASNPTPELISVLAYAR